MYPYPYEDPRRDKKLRYYAALGKELKKQEHKKIELERKAKAARERSILSVEWFIIGIIMHPIVGPLYNAAVHHVEIYTQSNP